MNLPRLSKQEKVKLSSLTGEDKDTCGNKPKMDRTIPDIQLQKGGMGFGTDNYKVTEDEIITKASQYIYNLL